MPTRIHTADLVSPIEALESYLRKGGATILQAAFEHSFFVDPNVVLAKTPYFPDRARTSREFYPNKGKGDRAMWEGREVTLGDNAYAQQAWQRYTGRELYRRSGYGVRHIWGHPWNPDAFTAGWNLCYMPFWAGMLTENQHPHRELKKAIEQASWDLFFRDNPVCTLPDFVKDPGIDLDSVLQGQHLLLLAAETTSPTPSSRPASFPTHEAFERVREVRKKTNQSWSNIYKGIRALQDKEHGPFSTRNVQSNANSTVRRIQRETELSVDQLEKLLRDHGVWKQE